MSDQRVEQSASDVLAAEAFGVPAPDPAFRSRAAPATDVLAAEQFGVPAPDPAFRSRAMPATDVLAAEEFGVPAPDPGLHHEHLVLPEDLVGNEARDVLVAEEFAMPAPDEARVRPRTVAQRSLPIARLVAINLPPLLGAVWLFWRLRRQKSAS
jgi:hypothetical protein